MGNKSYSKKRQPILKVLILGLSGSGKSTFAKQMKILHHGDFTTEERGLYREILLSNVLQGMKELIKQSEKLEHHVGTKNRKHARYFLEQINHDTEEPPEWSPSLVKKLQSLWDDSAIQDTWRASSLYQLQMHHMDYMMENLERFSLKDYSPSNEDILYARQRSTGFTKIKFKKDKNKWELIDVGGQAPERAKWEVVINDGVHAVIFFAGLDEYNMVSLEDRSKTKMEVSMEIWKDVMNSESMKGMCILLFLNKIDLLEKKINDPVHYSAFLKSFPDFQGEATINDVSEHIKQKFMDLVPEKFVYSHVICALNSDSMASVFNAVKENIFVKKLETLSLSNNFQ